MALHNPFANPEIAAGYEAWYQKAGRQADRQEKSLLKRLLHCFPNACSILEVGCGTGHFTRWFDALGFQATGLDVSFPMLEEAKRFKNPDCLQGEALKLPFLSKAFDLIALITTMEFLPDPVQVLTEAIRVARKGLILGMLNAQSHLGRQYKREAGPIWESARFYTPDELRGVLRKVVGEKPGIIWRTTLWPFWPGALLLPWGGFIGMAVKFS
jgi:ubiquinone/menaquinone biosynthesis C-methylase UbiE